LEIGMYKNSIKNRAWGCHTRLKQTKQKVLRCFAGELLGERDTWASRDDGTSMTRTEAEALFDGWTVERFEEEENDGEACSGPKHWHLFHVIALAP